MLNDLEARVLQVEAPEDWVFEACEPLLAATYVLSGPHRGELDAALDQFCDEVSVVGIGNAVRKLFERLKTRTAIRDLCAHMLRHTWATNFHRSRSGFKFDMQVEGGWTTGRMVERYCKARPFEERRKAPSPFTAARAAL